MTVRADFILVVVVAAEAVVADLGRVCSKGELITHILHTCHLKRIGVRLDEARLEARATVLILLVPFGLRTLL